MIILEIQSRLKQRDLDPVYLLVKIDGERANRCLTDLAWSEVLEWAVKRGEAIAEAKYGENVGEDVKLSSRLQLMTRVAERLHEALRSLGDGLDVYTNRCEQLPEDAMPVQKGEITVLHEQKIFDIPVMGRLPAIPSTSQIEESVQRAMVKMQNVWTVLDIISVGGTVSQEMASDALKCFDEIAIVWTKNLVDSAQSLKKFATAAAEAKEQAESLLDSSTTSKEIN